MRPFCSLIKWDGDKSRLSSGTETRMKAFLELIQSNLSIGKVQLEVRGKLRAGVGAAVSKVIVYINYAVVQAWETCCPQAGMGA